jgi:hypothetical protein
MSVADRIRELAGELTLEQAQRAHLGATAVLEPMRKSTLIALLATATGGEREAIIRQLGGSR